MSIYANGDENNDDNDNKTSYTLLPAPAIPSNSNHSAGNSNWYHNGLSIGTPTRVLLIIDS